MEAARPTDSQPCGANGVQFPGRAACAEPVACYVTSGSDDFMVEVAVRDLADYERVLLDQILAIPAITQARTTFAIRPVLSRGPVPLTHWR